MITRTHGARRCIVGMGAAAEIGGEAAALGRRALVIGGELADEVPGLVRFLRSVGLPVCLADLGLSGVTAEALLDEARRVLGSGEVSTYGMARPASAGELRDAMVEVDRLGRPPQ